MVSVLTSEFLLIFGGASGPGRWTSGPGRSVGGGRFATAVVMARAKALASAEVFTGLGLAAFRAARALLMDSPSPRVLTPDVALRSPRAFLMDAVNVLARERVLMGRGAPFFGAGAVTLALATAPLIARVRVAVRADVGRRGAPWGAAGACSAPRSFLIYGAFLKLGTPR